MLILFREEIVEAEVESSSSDESYTYSPQAGMYIKDSGERSQSANGNQAYTYKGEMVSYMKNIMIPMEIQ